MIAEDAQPVRRTEASECTGRCGIASSLNVLRLGTSKVESGNLLTLPVGGGLLYVQPVYVRSSASGGATSYPLLQRVLVSFGDKVGFAETLDEALDSVFGGDSGADAGDAGTVTPGKSGTPTKPSTPSQDLRQALLDAQQAIKDGQVALAKQDFAAYGEAQKRLQAALQRAVDADASGAGATRPTTPAATPTPSPSASPSTSPSASASPSAGG